MAHASRLRPLLTAVALVAIPRVASACPVCFGRSDSPLAVGTNMAIFFMLGVTGAVLAGFASFIVYLMRRARAMDGAIDAGAGGVRLTPFGESHDTTGPSGLGHYDRGIS
jgi:hypothetical protein